MDENRKKEPNRLDDPDFRNAEIAIKRAALKARERANRFGHGFIIYENGEITEEFPSSGRVFYESEHLLLVKKKDVRIYSSHRNRYPDIALFSDLVFGQKIIY